MVDKAAYRTVINSKRWRDIRTRLVNQRGYRCEVCGKTWAPGYKTSLQLHHKTYERLGTELDSDLQLLCLACHEVADTERANGSKRRSENALYNARLDGWASKKYGDDWINRDRTTIEDKFEEWLERHGEYD